MNHDNQKCPPVDPLVDMTGAWGTFGSCDYYELKQTGTVITGTWYRDGVKPFPVRGVVCGRAIHCTVGTSPHNIRMTATLCEDAENERYDAMMVSHVEEPPSSELFLPMSISVQAIMAWNGPSPRPAPWGELYLRV